MKIANKTYQSVLNPAAVDEISAFVRDFLLLLKLNNRDVKRYSLSVEEILLKTMETDLNGNDVTVTVGKKFARPFISIDVAGRSHNIFLDEEQSAIEGSILKNLGITPEYSYNYGVNNYLFKTSSKALNPFFVLLITLASASVCAALGMLLPLSFRTGALSYFLVPLHDAFLNILGSIAGPMVFLSVAWGIYGIGDAAALRQIGRRLLFGFVGVVYLFAAITTFIALPLFKLSFEGSISGGDGVSAIFNMILGVFPKNIFSPFVDGNTLQIIFLAIVIGIAMLFLGKKTTSVARAVEQINYIVQFLIEIVSKLVPYFVFIVIIKLVWSGELESVVGLGKFFVILFISIFVMVTTVISFTALKNRVRPLSLIKKGLPTFIIAVTTASSAACFGENVTACETRYGIHNSITSFGLPFGIATFKPVAAMGYAIFALLFAEMYGVGVSISWVVVLIFTAGILAVATPPIPGGSLTAYTVLLTQMGIPVEALAMALACDAVFDFICTGIDQFMLPIVLLNEADRLGMVDEKLLKSNNKNQ